MPRALELAERGSASIFRTLGVLRGGRPLHPQGVAFRATLRVGGGAGAAPLGEHREIAAIIRCSRSVGLPEWMPDLYGAAVRLLDAHGTGRHQDLLFVTGARDGPLRHLLLPAFGYRNRTMSTIAPYDVHGRACVFFLRAVSRKAATGRMRTLEDVARVARSGELRFELAIAPVGRGEAAAVGELVVGDPVSAAEERTLAFNPATTGGALVPITWVNRLRPASYRSSQEAR